MIGWVCIGHLVYYLTVQLIGDVAYKLSDLVKAVVNTVEGFWPIAVFFAGYRSFFFVPSRQTQTKARL